MARSRQKSFLRLVDAFHLVLELDRSGKYPNGIRARELALRVGKSEADAYDLLITLRSRGAVTRSKDRTMGRMAVYRYQPILTKVILERFNATHLAAPSE